MVMTCLGTTVMKIQATDADEPGNINSQIRYEIIKQEPSNDMFSINENGEVLVNNAGLDREVRQHKLAKAITFCNQHIQMNSSNITTLFIINVSK